MTIFFLVLTVLSHISSLWISQLKHPYPSIHADVCLSPWEYCWIAKRWAPHFLFFLLPPFSIQYSYSNLIQSRCVEPIQAINHVSLYNSCVSHRMLSDIWDTAFLRFSKKNRKCDAKLFSRLNLFLAFQLPFDVPPLCSCIMFPTFCTGEWTCQYWLLQLQWRPGVYLQFRLSASRKCLSNMLGQRNARQLCTSLSE